MIDIKSFETARTFVEICSRQDFDIDVSVGRYVVDGKSIMGVLGLDLTQPLTVHTFGATQLQNENFLKMISEARLLHNKIQGTT